MDCSRDAADWPCRAFAEALASDAPAPGGGGAAALVGAIGTALGGMVASLTLGRPRYAAVEQEMQALQERCTRLRQALLDQIAEDEAGFLPLARAYRLPKSDPQRAAALEQGAAHACAVPLEIMKLAAESVEILEILAEKGSKMLLSDAGCGAALCRAALEAAALNVFVNTKGMHDRAAAAALNAQAQELLEEALPRAEKIYAAVRAAL